MRAGLQPDWFAATIGDGADRMIVSARLQLRRVPGEWIGGDSQRLQPAEFFALRPNRMPTTNTPPGSTAPPAASARARRVHARNHVQHDAAPPRARSLRFPLTPPVSPLNSLSVRLFNDLIFHRPSAQQPHAVCTTNRSCIARQRAGLEPPVWPAGSSVPVRIAASRGRRRAARDAAADRTLAPGRSWWY